MSFFNKKGFESVKIASSTSGLNKNLTAFDLVLFGVGVIVGSGVFAMTGLVAAQYAGPAITLSYAIAGLTCVFVALAYTELATMLPTSGSIYTYSYVAFGEVVAWLVAGVLMIELGFATSSVAGSWSAYIQSILATVGYQIPKSIANSPFEGGYINLPAFLVICFVGYILYLGTTESKKLNSVLVLIKISAIFIFSLSAAPHFDLTNWDNFMPHGFDGVLHGSSILFFAFTGFGSLSSMAEECKNPKRDLMIGIMSSLLIATIIYIIVAMILTGISPLSDLNNAQPLAHALRVNGSHVASALVASGAVAGMTSVLVVNIYAQSRIFYVIARDGMLPKALAKLHHKYDCPYITLAIFTLLFALMAGFLPYDLLAKLSSMGALTDYVIVSIIVMIFRFRYPKAERRFKCPSLFIVAPIAMLASFYLLFKQIIGSNGNILTTGKIFLFWFVVLFIIYLIRYRMRSSAKNSGIANNS